MPRGSLRSNTYRKVFVRTPGSKTTIHYKKRKPSKAICAGCKETLAGVPRERPYKMENMAKTKKRPERPFGGVLCSSATKRVLIKKARELN